MQQDHANSPAGLEIQVRTPLMEVIFQCERMFDRSYLLI